MGKSAWMATEGIKLTTIWEICHQLTEKSDKAIKQSTQLTECKAHWKQSNRAQEKQWAWKLGNHQSGRLSWNPHKPLSSWSTNQKGSSNISLVWIIDDSDGDNNNNNDDDDESYNNEEDNDYKWKFTTTLLYFQVVKMSSWSYHLSGHYQTPRLITNPPGDGYGRTWALSLTNIR